MLHIKQEDVLSVSAAILVFVRKQVSCLSGWLKYGICCFKIGDKLLSHNCCIHDAGLCLHRVLKLHFLDLRCGPFEHNEVELFALPLPFCHRKPVPLAFLAGRSL